MKLFEILNKNTDKMGSWHLSYNEHKEIYESPVKYYKETLGYDDEDLENVDLTKEDIYKLQWYKNTPVGFISFFANSIEDLEKQVEEYIKD